MAGRRGLVQPTGSRHGCRPFPGSAVALRRPAPAPVLPAYLDHFRPVFPRRDQGASLGAYAQGLLSGERRKSIERMILRQLDGDMSQVRACNTLRRTVPGPTGCSWNATGRRWGPYWARAQASCWWTPLTCPDRGCIRWGWPGSE